MNQLYAPAFLPNISLSDLVNHIENLSDQNTPGNVPFSNNALGSDYPKEMVIKVVGWFVGVPMLHVWSRR